MKTPTRIAYLAPDDLAILIRQHGGSAWVETEQGRDIVLTRRSMAWVRKLCRTMAWMAPSVA